MADRAHFFGTLARTPWQGGQILSRCFTPICTNHGQSAPVVLQGPSRRHHPETDPDRPQSELGGMANGNSALSSVCSLWAHGSTGTAACHPPRQLAAGRVEVDIVNGRQHSAGHYMD